MDFEEVGGLAHHPHGTPIGSVVLTHGAGGSRDSALLIGVCQEWARLGWLAVRYNLPYRRRRPKGPPSGSAAADLAAVAEAVAAASAVVPGAPVVAGGHSYGGRLTSMAVAEQPGLVAALTLFSYPLHPPGKPERLRTDHFPAITAPTVFTHGSSDPFGSLEELRTAAALIPASTEIVEVTGARHDLGFTARRGPTQTNVPTVPARAVTAALRLGRLG
jgi:predicted alpha/beta-hydrolase family hydrolase